MVNGFDYKQYLEYVKKLNITEVEFNTFLKEFLLDQAQRVIRIAKQNTPVDTGALRESWSIGGQDIALEEYIDKDGKFKYRKDPTQAVVEDISLVGDNLEVTIWNPMEYAYWVEYGHSQEVGRYVPVLGKRLKKSWVDGYFMLTIAVNEVEHAMSGRFQKQFKKFLKDLGVV